MPQSKSIRLHTTTSHNLDFDLIATWLLMPLQPVLSVMLDTWIKNLAQALEVVGDVTSAVELGQETNAKAKFDTEAL